MPFSSTTLNLRHHSAGPPKFFSNPLIFLGMFLIPFDSTAKARITRMQQFFVKEAGYHREQSTKPQTLGYGLADSPVGILAWVYEKLVGWTDEYPWTDDEGACHAIFLDSSTNESSFDSAQMDLNLLLLSRWSCGVHAHLL